MPKFAVRILPCPAVGFAQAVRPRHADVKEWGTRKRPACSGPFSIRIFCRTQPPVPGDGLVIGAELVIGIELVPIVPADVAMLGLDIDMGALEAGMLVDGALMVPPPGAPC